MDIAQGNLGKVASYELDLVNGSLEAKVKVPVKELVKPFADKLKELIPGGIDDAIIDSALKQVFGE